MADNPLRPKSGPKTQQRERRNKLKQKRFIKTDKPKENEDKEKDRA